MFIAFSLNKRVQCAAMSCCYFDAAVFKALLFALLLIWATTRCASGVPTLPEE
jgi:hypothetical protein